MDKQDEYDNSTDLETEKEPYEDDDTQDIDDIIDIDEEVTDKIDDKEFLAQHGKTEQAYFIYYNNPKGKTDKDMSKRLHIPPSAYSKYRHDLQKKDTEEGITNIIILKGGKPAVYGLTNEARIRFKREYDLFLLKRKRDKENLDLNQQTKAYNIELAEQFQEFLRMFRDKYSVEVINNIVFLKINFKEILHFSIELADEMLEDPDDMRHAIQEAYKNITDATKEVVARIEDLTNVSKQSIKMIRSNHIGKLKESVAVIELISEPIAVIKEINYECPSCGNIIHIPQKSNTIKQPFRCGCGRKGKFREINRVLTDYVSLMLRPSIDELLYNGNNDVGKKPAFLKECDLTKKELLDQLSNNKPVRVTYIARELPKYKGNVISVYSDIQLELLSIKRLEKDSLNIKFTDDKINRFQTEASKPLFLEKFAESIYFNHYGKKELKKVLTIQLFSQDMNGIVKQEVVHILLYGEPSTDKTQLIKRSTEIAPISAYVDATHTSKSGLVGSVGGKDPITNKHVYDTGVIPTTNQGLLGMDEVTCFQYEDQKGLNEILADGKTHISKANVNATINSNITVLAGCNPTGGRFDDYEHITHKSIPLDDSFKSRFGFIFLFKDIPNTKDDELIALKIINKEQITQSDYDEDFCREYVLYARTFIKPKLSPKHAIRISQYYSQLRQMKPKNPLDKDMIIPRTVSMLTAFSLLHAKAHLRSETIDVDIDFAVEMMRFQLDQFSFDKEDLKSFG